MSFVSRLVKSHGKIASSSWPALTNRSSRNFKRYSSFKAQYVVKDFQEGPSVSRESSDLEVEELEIQQRHDRGNFFILKCSILETGQPSASTNLALSFLALGLFSSSALSSPAQASEAHSLTALYDVSESQEFWGNVLRYGRYFVTVMLGTGYVMLRPIAGMFQKSPLSALLAVGLIVGAVLGTKLTLDAMLGLSDQVEYASNGFM